MLEDLKQAATPAPPPNFRPGVTFDGQTPSEIVTPPLPKMESQAEFEAALRDLGYPLPEDMTVMLTEMQMVHHEAFWHRDKDKIGEQHTAYTAPATSWRYRFKVVPRSARHDADIAVLAAEARAADPVHLPQPGASEHTRVVALSDFQIGKTDTLGGTVETLARSEAALAVVLESLRAGLPSEIVLLDAGDSTEGFESSPNAAQTNDLHQTEQIRVWRRILWRWISALAEFGVPLKVIGVPSNHCRVRKGKAVQGSALDDWGIEVIAQVSDIAEANPEAYGHVEFIVPREHTEHVLVTLAGGLVLGLVHGHQKNSPNALTGWVKSTGRKGLAQADIVVCGHFHHLRVEAFGDHQWLMICPTNDNGSSWFTPGSGEESEPGILTFSVDDRGWFALRPIWLGATVS